MGRERDREREREKKRERERDRERETEKGTERETKKEREKGTEREKERQRERETEGESTRKERKREREREIEREREKNRETERKVEREARESEKIHIFILSVKDGLHTSLLWSNHHPLVALFFFIHSSSSLVESPSPCLSTLLHPLLIFSNRITILFSLYSSSPTAHLL